MLDIRPNRTAMSRVGVTAGDVQDTVAAAIGGRQAGVIFEGDRRFPVMIRMAESSRSDLTAVAQVPVPTAGGGFVPLSTVAFAFLRPERIGSATGLFNLMRNIGGSVGIAAAQTLLAKRAQFHQDRLVANISPYSQNFVQWMQHTVSQLMAAGQSQARAQAEAMGIAYQIVIRQATLMSFVDAFWLAGMLMAALIPVAFILRRPIRHH